MTAKKLHLLVGSLLLFSCAGQMPPSGGPVDTDPPHIVSTFPPPNMLHFRGDRIAIEFDEFVERRSVEESIFISPYVGALEFNWSRKEVEVRFTEPLRDNTTYVVTVGTDVIDLNNRNRMTQAFTLAFSTGATIDRGAVAGRVLPRRPTDASEGVMIFAYHLDELQPDTLDPRRNQPHYITQTGKDGRFALTHLRLGSYRLLAVRDEFRNLLYDPEADDVGVLPADITLSETDTLRSGLLIQLAREDTTAPRLLTARSISERRIMLEFSEPIDTASIAPTWFSIVDTVQADTLTVLAVSSVYPEFTKILLLTQTQEPTDYRVNVANLRDRSGNRIDPLANAFVFSAEPQRERDQLTIKSISVKDSARGVGIQPEILVAFSDVVQRDGFVRALRVSDATGNNVDIYTRWLRGDVVEIRTPLLQSQSWYTLTMEMEKLSNFFDEPAVDSTLVIHFETIDAETYSSLEGVVRDRHPIDTAGTIILIAEDAVRNDAKSHVVEIERPGVFLIPRVHAGKYLLRAFRDRNRNMVFDPGMVFPFQPAERLTMYPDTVRVRAGWPVDGIVIEFK